MKSKLLLLGTAVALSAAAATQSSAHNQGWYVGIEGGANWIGDNEGFAGFSSSPPLTSDVFEFDTGWAVLATVGYGFDQNWRLELEAGYRDNDVDRWATPFFSTNVGELNEITLMANVLFDVPLTDRLDLTFGLGAGVDRAELKSPLPGAGDDDDWSFAYQGIAGLSYTLTDRFDLTVQYRYFQANEPDFAVAHAGHIDSFAFEDIEKHTVTVGLRYDLFEDETPAAPMIAPPPPPPPAEAAQFIIYFGFNKCNITSEASRVLDEAASAAKSTGSASVQIVGHTDTVGSASFNQRLSECRANAAKTSLIGKGVAASSISASGRGETDLLIRSGDNVKEPQNRRATIDVNS